MKLNKCCPLIILVFRPVQHLPCTSLYDFVTAQISLGDLVWAQKEKVRFSFSYNNLA